MTEFTKPTELNEGCACEDNDMCDSSCRRWLFRDARIPRLIECQINYATRTRRV